MFGFWCCWGKGGGGKDEVEVKWGLDEGINWEMVYN